jgi:hypothetical protein
MNALKEPKMKKRESNQPKKTQRALYKAADELEAFFDKCCPADERRADHSVLLLRSQCLEYADYLTTRYDLDIDF